MQQGSTTHVLLCEPSATCRPVCHSQCHSHVICGHEPFRPLQALLHLTYALTSHLWRAKTTITDFLRSQRHTIGPIRVIHHSVYSRFIKAQHGNLTHQMEKHYGRVGGGSPCFTTSFSPAHSRPCLTHWKGCRSISWLTSTIIHIVSSSETLICQTVGGRNWNTWRMSLKS